MASSSPASIPLPTAGNYTEFVDSFTGHRHQVDSNGIMNNLAYPSLVPYVNDYWDCAGSGTATTVTSWQTTAVGAGTIAIPTASIASGNPTSAQILDGGNHPGVISISSSTTANSGIQATWGTSASALLIKGGEVFDCVFLISTFATTTYRFGFHDSATSADAVDGIYFELPASGAAVGKTSNNSVRTTSATIATLVVNTWYHARIKVNSNASSVTFSLYDTSGVLLGSQAVTTNIPITAGRDCLPRFIATNSGVVATFLCQLDLIGFQKPVLRGAKTV